MKNQLYKLIIDSVTNYCYKNCLEYFTPDSTILDVGIGNGVMLKNYHMLIKDKTLKITGIDINKSYLNHCDSLINKWITSKSTSNRSNPMNRRAVPISISSSSA